MTAVNQLSVKSEARTGFRAILVCIVLAIALGVASNAAGGMTSKVNSVLFISGLVGIGVATLALAGGLGQLQRSDKVLMVLMVAASVAAIMLTDLETLRDRGLRVTTPFAVAVVMAILGRIRRR